MGWAGFNCFLATLQKKIFLVGASLTITKNTPTWGNCEIIWIVALCALGSMQIGHRAQLSGGLTAYIAWHIVPWIQYTNNWRQVCQIGEFDFSTTASAMKEGKISWETIFWISLNFTGHGFLESQPKLFVFHLLKHRFYLMVLKFCLLLHVPASYICCYRVKGQQSIQEMGVSEACLVIGYR